MLLKQHLNLAISFIALDYRLSNVSSVSTFTVYILACHFQNIQNSLLRLLNWIHWNFFWYLIGVFKIVNCRLFPINLFRLLIIMGFMISPFVPNASFLYPLKRSENLKISWFFQVVEKGSIVKFFLKKYITLFTKNLHYRMGARYPYFILSSFWIF